MHLSQTLLTSLSQSHDRPLQDEFMRKRRGFHVSACVLIVSATRCQDGEWQTLPNFAG